MNQKLSIRVWLNKPKKKSDGTIPVYMKISVDSKRAHLSTNYYLKPNQWNSKDGIALGGSPNIAKINLTLSKWKTHIEGH